MRPSARQNRKGVLGPQHAAGVKRDQHHGPHLQAARQRVRDREALQRERGPEPADADREILRQRERAGRRRRRADEEHDAQRPGQRSEVGRSDHGRRRLMRQLGRPGRGIKIDATA